MSQRDSNGRVGSDDTAYAAGTVGTVGGLRDAGIPVHYLLDTVHPSGDVPSCVSEHLDHVSSCAGEDGAPDDVSARRAAMTGALSAALGDVRDLTPWQCCASSCPAVVGHMLVYRDSSHLSVTYSRWLAPMAQAVLENHASPPRA